MAPPVLVAFPLVMDNTIPGIGSLVQAPPQSNPNIPELSAVEPDEVKYKKWLAANPKGAPVDFPTWQAGMAQRTSEYQAKLNELSAQEHQAGLVSPEGLAARINSQSLAGRTDPSLPAAMYSHTVNDILAKPAQGWAGIGGGIGSAADAALGTGDTIEQVGQQVGHSIPRMFTSMIGGPVAMIGDTVADRYGETASPAKAAMSGGLTAATLGLAHAGGNLAEDMVSKQLLQTFEKTGAPAALESMSTGIAPKVARSAGANIGGVVGQELGHQTESIVDEGKLADPFTVQNIASQVMGGALMAVPDMVGTFTKTDINQRAQERLAEWANKRAGEAVTAQGLKPELGDTNTDLLIKHSIATNPPDTWRKDLISQHLDTIANSTDPVERTGTLGRLTDAVLQSRTLDGIADSAEKAAKLAYIKPPADIVGLSDMAQRVNSLKNDALSRLDDMVAQGDEAALSSTAYRQLETQGHLKDPITLDWLKTRFGDNVERSLSNSDSHGWLVLTQQLANEMKIIGETAKQARGEALAKESIATPTASKSVLDERLNLANFFDAISKIGDTKVREGILDRYLHHESNDNIRDTGDANKFMEEITQVVNSIAGGKDATALSQIDWQNTKGNLTKRRISIDLVTGVETRGEMDQPTGLGDYLAKGFNGEYTKSVYGRPSRSQNEILATDLGGGQRGSIPSETDTKQDLAANIKTSERINPREGVLDSVPATEGVIASGPDWAGTTDIVRKHITETAPDVLWRTIAPELMNARGSVDPRLARKLQPITKDLVQAVFELGPKGQDSGRTLSEAGQRVLKALNPTYDPTTDRRGPVNALSEALRTSLGTSRSDEDVRNGIIRRVAEKAGVGGPKMNRTSTVPWTVKQLETPKGQEGYVPTVDLVKWAKQFPEFKKQLDEAVRYRNEQGKISPTSYKDEDIAVMAEEVAHGMAYDRAFALEKVSPKPVGASGTGEPTYDAYRLFRNFYYRLGYEPDLADHFTKLSMQTVLNFKNSSLEIGALDQKTAYRALQTSFDKLATAGAYWNPAISPTGRPIIGLALDHYAEASPKALVAWHALSVLTHELVHDIQAQGEAYRDLSPATAYAQERVGAYQQLERMSNFYTPQQRFAFLRAVADASIPTKMLYPDGKMHNTIEGHLRYGAGINSDGTPDKRIPNYEFVNTFAQVIGLGMLTGGNGKRLLPEDVYNWMPEEQALFAKGVYRDLHDNLAALQQAVADPKYREVVGLNPLKGFATGDTTFLAHQLGQLVDKTKLMVMGNEPARSAAEAQQLASMLDAGLARNFTGPITRFELTDEADAAKVTQAKQAMESAQMLLFGEPSVEAEPTVSKGVKPPKPTVEKQLLLDLPGNQVQPPKPEVKISAYWRRAVLFQQTLDRMSRHELPLAQDVMAATRDFAPAQNRIAMGLWAPFMQVGGKFDPNNPLIQMRTDDTIAGRRDNAMVNKIMEWQQRNEVESLEQDQAGNWALTKKAADALGYTNIPQRVVGAIQKMSEVGQLMGQHLVESRVNSAANRTAKLMMTIFPDELGALGWQKAYTDATSIVRGMTYGDQKAVVAGLTPYPEPVRQAVTDFLSGGIVEGLQDLNKQVASRTWWMTEQRPGQYLIESYKDGVRHVDGAETSGQAMQAKADLTAKGFTDINVISRADRQKAQAFDAPEGILQHYIDLEQAHFNKYLDQNPNGLDPEQIANIRAYAPTPGEATAEMLQKRGTNKFLINRKGVPAAFGLDYTDNMRDYISRLASTTSRQAINQKVELILSDKTLAKQDQFKQYVRENVRQFMVPSSGIELAAKAFTTAYYMGANVSSMLVNATDAINTLPATLLTQAPGKYGLSDSVRHGAQGIKDAAFYGMKGNAAETDKLAKDGQAKVQAGLKPMPAEFKAMVYKKAVADGILQEGIYQDVLSDSDTDLRTLTAKTFGTTGQQLPKDNKVLTANGLYRVSKALMVIPHMTSQFNNQVVFMAAVNQAMEAGMTPTQAAAHADKVRTLALFAGGKSNAPGYIGAWGNEKTVPAFRVVHTLQQYTMGFIGKWIDHITEGISKDNTLTPRQRAQTLKAAGAMTTTMLATAGIMGLPGVAAIMVLLQKKFDINAEAAVREGIASLTGADKDNSGFRGLFTEIAMNGAPNQIFGVSIGQRLGMPDYLGLSSYDGYNLMDAAGPTVSLAGNMLDGLGYLGQGKVQKAATKLLPNALRRPVDMAMNKMKFGDAGFFNNSGQRIYDPNSADVLKYAMGFNPTELTERQRARQLVSQSNKSYKDKKAQHDDELGRELVAGNPIPAQQDAMEKIRTGQMPPSQLPAALRSLVDRGLTKAQPQDPLESTPAGNAPAAQAIVKTFPARDYQRQSELEKAQQRMSAEVRAGVPRTNYSQEFSRAMIVDEMVKRGLTQQEAERVAAMMGL